MDVYTYVVRTCTLFAVPGTTMLIDIVQFTSDGRITDDGFHATNSCMQLCEGLAAPAGHGLGSCAVRFGSCGLRQKPLIRSVARKTTGSVKRWRSISTRSLPTRSRTWKRVHWSGPAIVTCVPPPPPAYPPPPARMAA